MKQNNLRVVFRQVREECLPDLNKKCYICKKKKEFMEVHHRIPLNFNGQNVKENLVVLCSQCHKRFHNYKKINPTERYLIERLERLKCQRKE